MPTGLRRFFRYYGSKHRIAHLFPSPEHRTVVEPFAGSAGYALLHYARRVVLVEKDPIVAGVWSYLIGADPREILALPDVDPEGTIHELDVPEQARHLIGFWLGSNVTHHNSRPSSWMRAWIEVGYREKGSPTFWGPAVRRRIAAQLPATRHWRIVHASYEDCPDRRATWFVDPPYLGGTSTYRGLGSYYRINAATIDYDRLAAWVRGRRGQVIACEGPGARWLPFERSGIDEKLRTWYRSAA